MENFQITSVRGTEIGGFTFSFVGFQIPGFGVYKSWGFIKGFMSQGSEVLSLASVFAWQNIIFEIVCNLVSFMCELGRCRGWKDSEEEGKDGEEGFKRPVCQDKN